MRDTIDMARAAGIELDLIDENEGQIWYITTEGMKAFEALVRADERDRAMRENAYVQAERTANIACIGRIAALVGDPIDQARLHEAMDAIRARGNT
jgi:hypothetical protein